MTSLTKHPHPPHKKIFRVQTRRLAASFEPFTGSVALTEPEKFPCKTTCVSVVFTRKSPKAARRRSINFVSSLAEISPATNLTLHINQYTRGCSQSERLVTPVLDNGRWQLDLKTTKLLCSVLPEAT